MSDILPNLGLTGDYIDGSNDWGPSMDANLLALSVLVQAGASGFMAAVPGAPADDQVVVLTAAPNNGDIAVYHAGAWVYFTPLDGWTVFDRSNGKAMRYTPAGGWAEVTSGGGGGTGIPDGGTAGQVLTKIDATDGNADWETPSSGGGDGGAMTLLQTITLAADDDPVEFSDIAQGYKHLRLICNVGSLYTDNGNSDIVGLQFNADTAANYGYTNYGTYGAGSSFGNASPGAGSTYGYIGITTNDLAGAPAWGAIDALIPNYKSPRNKGFSSKSSCYQGNVGQIQCVTSGYWNGLAAITDIKAISVNSTGFKAGSVFSLYGIA